MKQFLISLFVVLFVLVVWNLKNPSSNPSETSEEGAVSTSTKGDAFSLKVGDTLDIEQLKSYHLPIIIDFGADWCPPCKIMKPNFEKIYQTFKKKAIFKYVDTDKAPQIANQYPVQYIPTQVFFNSDGTPYAPQNAEEMGLVFHYQGEKHTLTTHVGALSVEQMEQMLKEMGMHE